MKKLTSLGVPTANTLTQSLRKSSSRQAAHCSKSRSEDLCCTLGCLGTHLAAASLLCCVRPSPGTDLCYAVLPQVGDQAAWKSKNHPFRQDSQLHLTSIPTLMHWKADETCPGKRLDKQLESVHSAAAVKSAVLAFTEKAKEQDA